MVENLYGCSIGTTTLYEGLREKEEEKKRRKKKKSAAISKEGHGAQSVPNQNFGKCMH
tara:strand:+ start:44 stop:217 length:174 start_codon:yes stop_codon:yes gene_type:complete